jgi:ABC-type transporter MlaC component
MRATRHLHGAIASVILIVGVASTCAADVSASAPTATALVPVAMPSPIEFLKKHDIAVQAILTASDTLSAAQRASVKEQINAIFDFDELSRLSLGEHWVTRTEGERTKFVEVYGGIIEEQNFDTFAKHYRDGNIVYESEEVAGDKAVVAATLPLKRENVPISYLMHRSDSAWKVYDLVIDGTSTAATNRKANSRRIAKHSYEWLVERLEKQLVKVQGK